MGKMIKFNLSNNYVMVPEGERKLTISDIVARPSGNPTEVVITWVDVENKGTIKETIRFDKMLWKLSRLCQLAFGAEDGQEMDINEICNLLKGKTYLMEVVHTEGTTPREDGTLPKFANARKIISIEKEATSIENVIPTTMTSSASARSSILDNL